MLGPHAGCYGAMGPAFISKQHDGLIGRFPREGQRFCPREANVPSAAEDKPMSRQIRALAAFIAAFSLGCGTSVDTYDPYQSEAPKCEHTVVHNGTELRIWELVDYGIVFVDVNNERYSVPRHEKQHSSAGRRYQSALFALWIDGQQVTVDKARIGLEAEIISDHVAVPESEHYAAIRLTNGQWPVAEDYLELRNSYLDGPQIKQLDKVSENICAKNFEPCLFEKLLTKEPIALTSNTDPLGLYVIAQWLNQYIYHGLPLAP